MKSNLIVALASCMVLWSGDTFATAPAATCRNETAVQKAASATLAKAEKALTALERRYEVMERAIENRRIGLENRRAGIDSAVAFQETKMATCDVTSGILTQIFNDRNVTRAMCTTNPIIGQIVGTVIDRFKCQVQCGLLNLPACEQRCEQRIAADARRCARLAQMSCVRAVALRVKSDVITKQLNSGAFIATCTDSTIQGCPNGQLRSLQSKIVKTRTERDAAKQRADAADAALAACASRG